MERPPTPQAFHGYGDAKGDDEKMEIDMEARPCDAGADADEKEPSMLGHFEEVHRVKQGLHQRHIQMIALVCWIVV